MVGRKHYLTKEYKGDNVTPQSEQAPGTVPNSAGGFSFPVDDFTRLERFLILGSEGGTYYISQHKLTRDNAKCIERCLKTDGLRTVNTIVDVSVTGRAPKLDPAIFAFAVASIQGSPMVKEAVYRSFTKVIRTGTQLFSFMQFRKDLGGGFGAGLRRAISRWYLDRSVDQMSYQIAKYKQRDGWTHLDVLRLAHVSPNDEAVSAVFGYAKAKAKGTKEYNLTSLPDQIQAMEELAALETKNKTRASTLIREYRLTHEMVPSELKREAVVWDALLQDMPLGAMVRNLGNMSKVGLIAPLSDAEKVVCERLGDKDRIKKARLHPLALLLAQKTYESGKSLKGSGVWNASQRVVDALNDAFYLAFQTIEPTRKNHLLGVDVSGSMSWGNFAGGLITPREAAAVMALVTAKTEPNYHIMGFSSKFVELKISPTMRLPAVMKLTERLPFERTDCALPMTWAQENNVDVDAFVVYTDSETWFGNIYPFEALQQYRRARGIAAKSAVVAFESNGFTIADPTDAGMMDFVGFDTAAPRVLADFIRG